MKRIGPSFSVFFARGFFLGQDFLAGVADPVFFEGPDPDQHHPDPDQLHPEPDRKYIPSCFSWVISGSRSGFFLTVGTESGYAITTTSSKIRKTNKNKKELFSPCTQEPKPSTLP